MKHKLRLWYHQKMYKLFAKLADSVDEHPYDGMTEEGELLYLDCFCRMRHHQARLKEMGKGA